MNWYCYYWCVFVLLVNAEVGLVSDSVLGKCSFISSRSLRTRQYTYLEWSKVLRPSQDSLIGVSSGIVDGENHRSFGKRAYNIFHTRICPEWGSNIGGEERCDPSSRVLKNLVTGAPGVVLSDVIIVFKAVVLFQSFIFCCVFTNRCKFLIDRKLHWYIFSQKRYCPYVSSWRILIK